MVILGANVVQNLDDTSNLAYCSELCIILLKPKIRRNSLFEEWIGNYLSFVSVAHPSSSVAEEEDLQPSSPSSGTSGESGSRGPHHGTRSQVTPVKKSGTTNDTF